MGVFRTKFVTENVEQYGAISSNIEQYGAISSNMEKRERERERLKTLPYMPNFQKEPSIDSREPSVSNFDERTENVEWGYFVQNL